LERKKKLQIHSDDTMIHISDYHWFEEIEHYCFS